VLARFYSSEADAWGDIISAPLPPSIPPSDPTVFVYAAKPAVLVENSLYWILAGHHYQDHLEVLGIFGSPKHRPVESRAFHKFRRNGNVALAGGDGIPHQELLPLLAEDEYEAMAAAGEPEAVAVVELQGEAPGRDAIWGLQRRFEAQALGIHVEETEKGRVAAVAEAEALEEFGIGDEAAPATGDEGGAREGGRQWGVAEEDLFEEVVVLERRRRRRRVGAAAAAEARRHLALHFPLLTISHPPHSSVVVRRVSRLITAVKISHISFFLDENFTYLFFENIIY
jgi:hypothetical protein